MSQASTSTVIDQTSDAAFRTWIAEIITQLTACGLTQTADTGQIDTSAVTVPAVNTAAGYSIFAFNDPLQGTSPVFIKLEYGAASPATIPMMWVTVGTGSDGAGNLTGTQTVRAAVTTGVAPVSNATSYTSRYSYNATVGYLAIAWKQNANSPAGPNGFMGGFVLFRSNDPTGAATGDSVNLIANAWDTSPLTYQTGCMQCLSYLTSSLWPAVPALANTGFWAGSASGVPLGLGSTTYAGNSYVAPIYYQTPIPAVSAFAGIALASEAPVGSTLSAALVGSTALTFLSCGGMFGSGTYLGAVSPPTQQSFLMLWQ